MNQTSEIEGLLAALPKLTVGRLPVGTPVPRMPSVKPLIAYNGFDGYQRMRTWEVTKWLMEHGVMPRPSECDLCGKSAAEYHGENYFDFSGYVPVCLSCHRKIHSRLRFFAAWQRSLKELGLAPSHWTHRLTQESLPVAEWCNRRGLAEPTFADFVGR